MRPNQGEDPRQSPDRPPEHGSPQSTPPRPPGEGQQPPPGSGAWAGQYGPQQQPPAQQPPQQPPTRQAPPQQAPPQGPPAYGPPQQQPPSQFGSPQTGSPQPAPPPSGTGAPAGQPPQGQPVQPATEPPRAGGPQLRPVTVEDIVQTDVVTAERDTPVATVVAKMAEEDVGSVVVVEDERPVGLVTDRDIALALEDTGDITDQAIGDLVTGEPVTGTVEMAVSDAVERLEDAGIRRLPIVDDEGALEGIVTLDDILVLLEAELGNAANIIRTQSPRF